jgi:hypothetical protein
MMRSRILWSIWALMPVGVMAFHFGPGQRAWVKDQASRSLANARSQQAEAEAAQDAAFAAHLEGLKARQAAHSEDGTVDPVLAAKAKAATEAESAAYAAAALEWDKVSTSISTAIDLLKTEAPESVNSLRWARGRAQIRAGKIESGIAELEELVDEFELAGTAGTTLARDAREDLATGYYYKARLMRLGGAKSEEWREVSGKSRQQFRYLAETAQQQRDDASVVSNYQNNVELVLNMEQSSINDLQAKARPKNAPQGNKDGNRPNGKKSKRPPRRKDDRDGAGGVDEIGPGW